MSKKTKKEKFWEAMVYCWSLIFNRQKLDDEKEAAKVLFRGNVKQRVHLASEVGEDGSWLKEIYRYRVERFNIENDRIWETGKIIIPVSLAAVVPYAQMSDANALSVFALGFGATTLLVVWHRIATAHRQYQDEHMAWIEEIEILMESQGNPDQIVPTVKSPRSRFNLHMLRKVLIAFTFFVWAGFTAKAIFSGGRHHQENDPPQPGHLRPDTAFVSSQREVAK